MNIAIVNRTNLKNFGSVLQVYALCKAVNKLGHNVEVVWESGNMSKNFDIRFNKVIKIFTKLLAHPSLLKTTLKTLKGMGDAVVAPHQKQLFEEFVHSNFKRSFYSAKQIKQVASTERYQKFICGSDQIWSSTTLYPDPMFYLRFAPKDKRIAYAPSIGRDYIPDYNQSTLRKYISDIPYVSIREDEGRRLILDLTGRDVPVVADPTFLMSHNEWDKLKTDVDVPQFYILCYFLDEPSNEVKDAICDFANNQNRDIVVLGKLGALDYPSTRIFHPVAGPGEFLTLVSKSDMVITDSYHGMLFAINYHKKFWSVERAYAEYNQSSRQLTVLMKLGLKDRHLKGDYHFNDTEIDYEIIQSKVDEFVDFSMNYLKDAINA